MKQVLLFDFDGTLFYSVFVFMTCVGCALEQVGFRETDLLRLRNAIGRHLYSM